MIFKSASRLLGGVLLTSIVLYGEKISAQSPADLFAKIEAGIKQQQPTWKIDRVIRNAADESIVLRRGKQQAAIGVLDRRQLQDARQIFAGQVIVFDNIRGKSVTKRSLPNFADENFMWTNAGREDGPTIYFRKGNFFVSVYAPTVSTVKDLAQSILVVVNGVQ